MAGMLRFLDTPKRASFDDLAGKPFHTLLMGYLLNPYGPTVTIVRTNAPLESEDVRDILVITLNPFQQTIAKVGEIQVRPGENLQPSEFHQLFELDFGPCPSLMFVSSLLQRDKIVPALQSWVISFEDASRVYDGISLNPADPLGRIAREVQHGIPRIRPLSKDQALTLAGGMLAPSHVTSETLALATLWPTSSKCLVSPRATR